MAALILYVVDAALCQYLSRSANGSCIFESQDKEKQMQAVATYYPECNAVQLTVRDKKSFSPCKMVTPGSYVYIKCPSISSWQWHPFSVTPVSVFYERSIHFFFHLFLTTSHLSCIQPGLFIVCWLIPFPLSPSLYFSLAVFLSPFCCSLPFMNYCAEYFLLYRSCTMRRRQ